jgi:hypothetical protein
VEDNILYTLAIPPVICLFFVTGLIYSIRKYKNFPILKTVKQSIETGIYMSIIWIPMVSYIVFKIIFSERSMDWGKTEHGTEITAQQNIFIEQVD